MAATVRGAAVAVTVLVILLEFAAPVAGDTVTPGSHESLLCGQSDHLDRDPTSAGRGSDSATVRGEPGHRKKYVCMYVRICMCLHAREIVHAL